MKATKHKIDLEQKYLFKDGNGGFKSANWDSAKSFAIVKGTNITFGWKFEEDGPVITELYTVTYGGTVMKTFTENVDAYFVFKNKKAGVTKHVHKVLTVDEKIFTDESIGPWLTEEGVVEYRNGIEIPDGTYPVEPGDCIVVNDDCEVYVDNEHAAWYSEPTIDGKSETCRAKLLDLGTDIGGDKCIEEIQRTLSALKRYAESNNIKLWYDYDSDEVHAVKVPKGYKCTMDEHRHKDMIPRELMPVVGHLDASTNSDSFWQMGLVKIPEVKEGGHAD